MRRQRGCGLASRVVKDTNAIIMTKFLWLYLSHTLYSTLLLGCFKRKLLHISIISKCLYHSYRYLFYFRVVGLNGESTSFSADRRKIGRSYENIVIPFTCTCDRMSNLNSRE